MPSEALTALNDVPDPPAADAHDQSLLARLVRVSDPADERAVASIRLAFAFLASFELVYLVEVVLFESKLLQSAMSFISFDIALAAGAFGATYTKWFKRHWRGITMAVCVAVIVSRTLMGIAVDEDDPALLVLFAMVLGTAMLVPWSLRWELWLMAAGLVSFTAVSIAGTVDLDDVQRWIILAAAMALAINFMSLKKYYLAQAALIEALTATRNRLSAEVAERQAAEQLAREQEVALRTAMEASLDAMTIKRVRDDIYLEVNHEFARMTGHSREALMGASAVVLHIWDDPAAYRSFYDEVKSSGAVRNREVAIRTADGKVMDGLVSARMVELNGEQCVVATTRDITERKALENELVAAREAALAASRAKSEFLSSMSHEIRTPMNAILGLADLLAEDSGLTTEQHRYVETMRSNGNALLHLINDILDLAKIESGKLSLESIGFDLEELIDKTLQTMSVRAHGKGLELVARIMPDVPRKLVGDPLRLGQILINLIGNAVKFTEEGEVALTVAAVQPGADRNDSGEVQLRFSVKDTGIGIPADRIDSIFSGFTQADPSTTRRFGGSGLGLTIVTRLMKLMGGTVDVQSDVGRGSTFSFTITLPQDPQPAISSQGETVRLDGVRVLIVDDNATNRLILRETLVRIGATITEVNSGEAALAEHERARASGDPYRLMLLDYRMPEMDGAEVARRVLAEERTRHADGVHQDKTMILMLTSEDLNIQLTRLRALGLQTYLIKPIRRLDLLQTIGRLLTSDAAVPARLTASASKPESKEPALRILLADDSPDNCLLIKAYFKALPWKIDLAENGLVAIEKFKASPHDIVLMDIRMPEMDGLTATRAIRRWEKAQKLAETPIIALTAAALAEDVERSLRAGCNAHVSKPVRKSVLIEAVRTHLAKGVPATDMALPEN